jgi:catechol 2,3-dioxygenase-like lactoylglutathione lyase family enzyme
MEASDGLRIHHVDLAVGDVERSLAFYLAVLAPLGLREWERFPTYRGTEEVVYLSLGEREQYLGLRPADGGGHRYYEVGLEHLAFYVDTREEVDAAHRRSRSFSARRGQGHRGLLRDVCVRPRRPSH